MGNKELAEKGIHIRQELDEAEKETGTAPIDERLLSEGSRTIRRAAEKCGYKMDLMPKFIDAGRCRKCGNCGMGCKYDAKWSALYSLQEAIGLSAQGAYGTTIDRVVVKNGKAAVVLGRGPGGAFEAYVENVIVCAGGLAPPDPPPERNRPCRLKSFCRSAGQHLRPDRKLYACAGKISHSHCRA